MPNLSVNALNQQMQFISLKPFKSQVQSESDLNASTRFSTHLWFRFRACA